MFTKLYKWDGYNALGKLLETGRDACYKSQPNHEEGYIIKHPLRTILSLSFKDSFASSCRSSEA